MTILNHDIETTNNLEDLKQDHLLHERPNRRALFGTGLAALFGSLASSCSVEKKYGKGSIKSAAEIGEAEEDERVGSNYSSDGEDDHAGSGGSEDEPEGGEAPSGPNPGNECQTFFDTYGIAQADIDQLSEVSASSDFDIAIWGTHGGADGSRQSALLALAPKAGAFSTDDLIYIVEDDKDKQIAPVLAMHRVGDLTKRSIQVFDNLFINSDNEKKLRILVRTFSNGSYIFKNDTKWSIDGSEFTKNPEGLDAVTSSRDLIDPFEGSGRYTDLMPFFVLGDAPDSTAMVQFGNPDSRPLKIAEAIDSSWDSLQIKLKFEGTVGVSYVKNEDNTWSQVEVTSSGSDLDGSYDVDVRTILNQAIASSTLEAENSYSFDLIAATENSRLLAEHNMFVVSVKDNDKGTWYRYFYFLG